MRTWTFRWTLIVSGAFTVGVLLMFGLVLAQSYSYLTADVDRLVVEEANLIAAEVPGRRVHELNEHLRDDPLHIKIAAIFDAEGHRLFGNVETIPANFPTDGLPRVVPLVKIDSGIRVPQTARAVARRLSGGLTLVIGRQDYEFAWIVSTVERALVVGLIPALCLGLGTGAVLSIRSQKRVEELNRKVQRIVAGELRERLPSHGSGDPLDRLAVLVNGMLDEIEALVQRLAGVGDDIAHDLRTPLTRVRVSLERARQRADTLEDLRGSVDDAIVGLDQSLAIITALLRIAEIEHSRRVDRFQAVELAQLIREVGELYEPIADEKRVDFVVTAEQDTTVHADRDLLFEAVVNLVDNAVKFTPEGGRVEIALQWRCDEAVIRVCDSGPGIEASEQDFVGRRFYRSDKSRRSPGLGLGLSLVTAIANLHGFRFSIATGPGCVAEIVAQRATIRPCRVPGSSLGRSMTGGGEFGSLEEGQIAPAGRRNWRRRLDRPQ